ncbi:unnamed protein product [Rotaria socialis]|uniref:PPIase cyclophilin-type domain-containing protein n=1 Tax=Rotaria socialis TaxID=392032 RepID=A0A818UR48_9BILA|nr:unnamed protein product [Rotaria socialis]
MGKILLINFKNIYLLFRKHVVFGHVISGQSVVNIVQNISVDSNRRSLQDVVIAHCGQLIRNKKAKDDNNSQDLHSHRHGRERNHHDQTQSTSQLKHKSRSTTTIKSNNDPSDPKVLECLKLGCLLKRLISISSQADFTNTRQILVKGTPNSSHLIDKSYLVLVPIRKPISGCN